MSTRHPGSAGLHRDASHPPSVDAKDDLHFHCAFRFSFNPMTRAHVRLLGPCFKTGPESTQSKSVADRYIRSNIKSQSEDIVDQQPHQAPGNGTRSVNPSEVSLSTSLNALGAAQYRLIIVQYRRAAGQASRGLTRDARKRDASVDLPGRRPTPNGSRRPTRGEVHADHSGTYRSEGVTRSRSPASSHSARKPKRLTMNLPIRSFGFLRFTPERFHVLLNSLFKVLFNFPSRYLFAIGLVEIFSLRWSLPPT